MVPRQRGFSDHKVLSQHPRDHGVIWPRNNQTEANMPFLFWMPMIVMCGMWRAAEEDAKILFTTPE
jgi:hypothetical protein